MCMQRMHPPKQSTSDALVCHDQVMPVTDAHRSELKLHGHGVREAGTPPHYFSIVSRIKSMFVCQEREGDDGSGGENA